MNLEIIKVRNQLFELYERQRKALEWRTTPWLQDLMHECEQLRRSDLFSERVAAEINGTAATLILEGRPK